MFSLLISALLTSTTPVIGAPVTKEPVMSSSPERKWTREQWIAAGNKAKIFDQFDTDKNGILTRAEMRIGLRGLAEFRSLPAAPAQSRARAPEDPTDEK